MTVLLDSFVTATAQEERVQEVQEIQAHKTRTDHNSLDPLLSFFVDHFDTNEDLSLRIRNLFQVPFFSRGSAASHTFRPPSLNLIS